MLVQVDLKNIKEHFIFFKMNEYPTGYWLFPKEDMKDSWQHCFELIICNDIHVPKEKYEKYDGSQEIVDYIFEESAILLNFEFPDEESALYFNLKFGHNL